MGAYVDFQFSKIDETTDGVLMRAAVSTGDIRDVVVTSARGETTEAQLARETPALEVVERTFEPGTSFRALQAYMEAWLAREYPDKKALDGQTAGHKLAESNGAAVPEPRAVEA